MSGTLTADYQIISTAFSTTTSPSDLTIALGTFSAANVGQTIVIPLVNGGAAFRSAIMSWSSATPSLVKVVPAIPSAVTVGYQASSVTVAAPGTGVAPGDIITIAGGTFSYATQVIVKTTQVVSATVVAGGSLGPANTVVTLTGMGGGVGGVNAFTATGTINAGGSLQAILAITSGGMYAVTPNNLAAQPVIGGGLIGATVSLAMGALAVDLNVATLDSMATAVSIMNPGTHGSAGAVTVTGTSGAPGNFIAAGTIGIHGSLIGSLAITNPGVYFQGLPSPGTEPVTATSGLTGAIVALTLKPLITGGTITQAGGYTVQPTNPAIQGSTTGGGINTSFNVNFVAPQIYFGTDNTATLNSMIATSENVVIPPGSYYFDSSKEAIIIGSSMPGGQSSTSIVGSGIGNTILVIDDTISSHEGAGITNLLLGAPAPQALSHFSLQSLTIKGMGDINISPGSSLVYLTNATNALIEDCEILYGRFMSVHCNACSSVTIKNNRLSHSQRDGFACWDTDNLQVTGNFIFAVNDDCISAHTNDATSPPLRSAVLIDGNTITESQGIRVSGGKLTTVSNNIMRRIMTSAIVVSTGTSGSQGDTALMGVKIIGNNISDCFLRPDATPLNGNQLYIKVGGGQKNPITGGAPPGMPYPGTGAVTNLYGSNGVGNFWVNGTEAGAMPLVPSPGGFFVEVRGNTLARTLPAVTQYSQWMFGASLWVGQDGIYNGPINELHLNTQGILVEPTLTAAIIADNVIDTSGPYGIVFDQGMVNLALDYDIRISRNLIRNFTQAGIQLPLTNVGQRFVIDGNEINADPLFVSGARGSHGTWNTTDNSPPFGINTGGSFGALITGNIFKNLNDPIGISTTLNNVFGNFIVCVPLISPWSNTNQGVAGIRYAGSQYTHIIEYCDPTNASYGQLMNATMLDASSVPTGGYFVAGTFINNTPATVSSGKILLGWKCLTTGAYSAGNWTTVYATIM